MENSEVFIEGCSDTASINQASLKAGGANGCEMSQFPGLFNVDDAKRTAISRYI